MPNAEMSPITSCSLSGIEENDDASGLPDPGSIENVGESEYTLSTENKFFCEVLNKEKDASSEMPLHDVTDNQQSDECESSSLAQMQCSSNNLNVENADVSDTSELLSYAVIDGVKHTAMLVKFDETDFNSFKINVPTHKELDVLHSQSDGNYAVESSFSSEYESTDWISGTDHGDAQSLNKSPRLKRKRVKTKRVTVLAKLPAISTSNIVNKSNQESNIEVGLTSVVGTAANNPHAARLLVEISKYIPEEVILSLPNEGTEDFEINPILATAIKTKVLTLYSNQFLLVCAKHLLKINKGSMISKGMYKRYAKLVVEKYPSLKDSDFEEDFLSVKTKIIKAINNQRGNMKTKES